MYLFQVNPPHVKSRNRALGSRLFSGKEKRFYVAVNLIPLNAHENVLISLLLLHQKCVIILSVCSKQISGKNMIYLLRIKVLEYCLVLFVTHKGVRILFSIICYA